MAQSVLIMDIDHTVSDSAWRDPMMAEAYRTGDWEEYNASAVHDAPLMDVVRLVRDLHAAGWLVVACTGRNDTARQLTLEWLIKYDVPFADLLMRPFGDRRTAPELKVAMVREYLGDNFSNLVMVIDDRADVVAAFKAIGVTAIQIHAQLGKNHDGQRQLRAEYRGSPFDPSLAP